MAESPGTNQIASLLGDIFEVLVKRGVIGALLDQGLLSSTSPIHPELQPWEAMRYSNLADHLVGELEVVDPTYERLIRELIDHLAIQAYGLGWTTLRTYLKTHRCGKGSGFQVIAWWCPLGLPHRIQGNHSSRSTLTQKELGRRFWKAMGLTGDVDSSITAKGHPAMADFLLIGREKRGRTRILCLEFSLNTLGEINDYTLEAAHLTELAVYASQLERRGVFSRVSAEVSVENENFTLSRGLIDHIGAFTSRDKPLYKLCQGSSYAVLTERLLRERGVITGPVELQVLAVTATGIEGFAATVGQPESGKVQYGLMESLGEVYRVAAKTDVDSPEAYTKEIRVVYDRLRRVLPQHLQSRIKTVLDQAEKGFDSVGRVIEPVSDFLNPNDPISESEYAAWLPSSPNPQFDSYFQTDLGLLLRDRIKTIAGSQGQVTLRVLHEAAVSCAMARAPKGLITIFGLEGHPGIGKTTAVVKTLASLNQGFLFFYLSPRVVINSDVTEKVARRDGKPTGTLALTTNSILIRGAAACYRDLVNEGQVEPRSIKAAVLVDGVEDLVCPDTEIWTVDQDLAHRIDSNYGSAGLKKKDIDDRKSQIQDILTQGVLKTLATHARDLAKCNPTVNQIVLTAAVQGYREMESGKNTVGGLSSFFRSDSETPKGVHERTLAAQRFPTIVVMVDELAGDGAGSPLVHELTDWLYREFIGPFACLPDGSPFQVILILADASLGNEVVLEKYLAHRDSPDKVLISTGTPDRPFRLAIGAMKLGGATHQVFHVMADAFPARSLDIEYVFGLHAFDLREAENLDRSPRQLIRKQTQDLTLGWALTEIQRAIDRNEPQIILFAQDKAFLGDLKHALQTQVPEVRVAILDSSVHPTRRKQLISPNVRDLVRVFLMTSSGARGVSFPKTTCIIAFVPRFSLEAGLMEIAQLVYRGRGTYVDPETREERSGDHEARRLVLLLHDFILEEGNRDPRQWVRHSVDLVTLLALVRSSILTRVKGDAGLYGRSLAVVPVGRIGTDELVETMTDSLRSFLREATVYISRGKTEELKGLVVEAAAQTQALFGQLKVEGYFKQAQVSFANTQALTDFCKALTSPAKSLLRGAQDVQVPEKIFCLGPVWLEQWDEAAISESFLFEVWHAAVETKRSTLLGLLSGIKENTALLPPTLRRPAEVLHKILIRDRATLEKQYSTEKHLKTKRAWLVLPTDFPRFMISRLPDGDALRFVKVSEPDLWLSWLNRAIDAIRRPTATLPVVAGFKTHPYLMLITSGDPTDLDRALNPQCFLASTELNLLNAVLFAEEAP